MVIYLALSHLVVRFKKCSRLMIGGVGRAAFLGKDYDSFSWQLAITTTVDLYYKSQEKSFQLTLKALVIDHGFCTSAQWNSMKNANFKILPMTTMEVE